MRKAILLLVIVWEYSKGVSNVINLFVVKFLSCLLFQYADISWIVERIRSLNQVTIGQVETVNVSIVFHKNILISKIISKIQNSDVFVVSSYNDDVVQNNVVHLFCRMNIG